MSTDLSTLWKATESSPSPSSHDGAAQRRCIHRLSSVPTVESGTIDSPSCGKLIDLRLGDQLPQAAPGCREARPESSNPESGDKRSQYLDERSNRRQNTTDPAVGNGADDRQSTPLSTSSPRELSTASTTAQPAFSTLSTDCSSFWHHDFTETAVGRVPLESLTYARVDAPGLRGGGRSHRRATPRRWRSRAAGCPRGIWAPACANVRESGSRRLTAGEGLHIIVGLCPQTGDSSRRNLK